MSKKLTIEQIEERIASIECCYPQSFHIDMDRDGYHPYDRNNLIRYYNLLAKRIKENREEEWT